ncbi:MAG: glycosyltransferase [Clostridia bacterium]|nr:glycosyltransferase [Clostridia bacterium]
MKKVLFIIPTLGNGGAEKSFISLLNNLNSDKYEVDVFAIRPTGLIADMLPDYVDLIPLPQDVVCFKEGVKASVLSFLKKGKFVSAFNRIMFSYTLAKYQKTNEAEQRAFRYYKGMFKGCFNHYDVAVSYLEKTTNYIVSEMIDADIKVGYYHSDYDKLRLNSDLEKRLIKNLNYLVTVSDNCAEILKESLPEHADRVKVIENIISRKALLEQASEENPFNDGFNGIRVVTAGRVSPEKGPDIAVEACRILREKGYDIRWHFVGKVDDETAVSLAKEYGISQYAVFEGLHTNPYKFIYNCDIYVQPSRFEGKSIAIEEAKALGRPVVTSAFTTAFSQIEQNKTGIVADEISAQAIAEKIELLIKDKELYEGIKRNLENYQSNEDEVLKLEKILDKGDGLH